MFTLFIKYNHYTPISIIIHLTILVDFSTDSKIKTDFLELISVEFPNFRTFNDKNQKFKFIIEIQDENLLKSLCFSINLLFKNRENLKHT